MQVKFEYESIGESITDSQFTDELKAYCSEVLITEVRHPIMNNADRLFGDKCFVVLLHKWCEVNNEINKRMASFRSLDEADEWLAESYLSDEYTHLSWLIGDLL